MTIEEKIGQLCQYSGSRLTGPVGNRKNELEQDIKTGRVGAVLNVSGVNQVREIQKSALQSRLHVPLLFGLGVIHGYKTTFPTPIAQAATWNLNDIREAARISAKEASAAGINWTFSPMADIAWDPRWGRVTEGPGGDPYLASRIIEQMVRGYQGHHLGDTGTIMACAKHFSGYGSVAAGGDYNTVDMGLQHLWQFYLPPFKAAADAGAVTFMSAFNTLKGIPCTGNEYLLKTVLKKDWNFKGFVVSDWNSIGEMVIWGYAQNRKDAALKAILAGCDMDMEAAAYQKYLKILLDEKVLSIEVLDDAVKRVLYQKFQLGLFDRPFKYCDNDRENRVLSDTTYTIFAEKIAAESIVLLKNSNQLLPLSFPGKRIALIGPLVKSKGNLLGSWTLNNDTTNIQDLWDALKDRYANNTQLSYAKGCDILTTGQEDINHAVSVASDADVIIKALGEATSRADIRLPGKQEELFMKIKAIGKPVIVVLMAGRPLIFNEISMYADAITDILSGACNPSARLPISFPQSMGQIPIPYLQYNIGRPYQSGNKAYHSAYIDAPNSPAYIFGYGLSYSNFEYKDLHLNKTVFGGNDSLTVSCTVSNKSNVGGKETVQLYIRDETASTVRPIKELRHFLQVYIGPRESRTVQFVINKDDLSFYNSDLKKVIEPGFSKL